MPRTLKGVIDFLPPFRAWGKRRKSIQLIMHKSGQSKNYYMLPNYYEFYNPVKIVAGKDALKNIKIELDILKAKKPIIITDKGIVNAGLLKIIKKLLNDLKIVCDVIFDEVPSDSSIKVVNEISKLFKSQQCDSIIAVGGGSVIDTAKGVNIVISENTDNIRELIGVNRLTAEQKPLIVIPTTAGTGSEATLVAVITDTENDVKMLFTSNRLIPSVAIIDPRMTISLPPILTASTGMDALTHAIEAYTCLQKNPISDSYAIIAIKQIRDNLFNTIENGKDKMARFAMANASLMAGIAFSNSMVGAVHSIGHSVGAISHTHHGNTMAILLPYILEYNIDVVAELYGELLQYLVSEQVYYNTPMNMKANRFIDEIKKINRQLNSIVNMPITLKDVGVKKEQFNDIARKTLGDGAIILNPKELNYDDIISILNKAF
ncbi:MAG: iron-containing alcohol dehydrogenase [Bacteroidales bacterium]|nr:iron-containing alcohol dehydrogenase [Bacteroidales bacterium]